MNPFQLLQAFLLAAASLVFAQTFYAKIDDRYERLRSIDMAGYSLVTLGDEQFPHVPLFTLNNSIAISSEGNQSKVFGKVDRFFVVGNKELVKPFKIQLDNDSKVTNVSIHLCTGPQSFLPKTFVSGTTDTAGLTCSPQGVYFLSPTEVEELESVSKAETETNTPEEILEENELKRIIFGGLNKY